MNGSPAQLKARHRKRSTARMSNLSQGTECVRGRVRAGPECQDSKSEGLPTTLPSVC